MNKKRNEKAKNLLFILLFILSLSLYIYLLVFVKKPIILSENQDNNESEIFDTQEDIVKSDIVLVKNISEVYDVYKGYIKRIDLTTDLRKIFTEEIYNLNKEENSQSYFNKNKKKISSIYGISNYEEYEKLMKYIKDYGETVTGISVNLNSVHDEKDYVNFKITVTFNNNTNNTKEFLIRIQKQKNDDIPYIVVAPNT